MKQGIMICVAAVLILAAGSVQADMVTWSTGGVTKDYIGWDGTYPGAFDIVTLSAAGGSLTLELWTPVEVAINPLTFDVGLNAQGGSTNLFTMTRDITVNGVTGSLSNEVSNAMRVDISYSDTLYVYGGPPVRLGDIIVTPLGWTTGLPNGGGTVYSSVSARFELVPVPGAVLLGMLGLSVAGLKLRKFA